MNQIVVDFSFEDHAYNKLMSRAGMTGNSLRSQLIRVIVPVAFCWLPMAIGTVVKGTFWTGEITNSFITSFDTQVRFLVSMPLFIVAEYLVAPRLSIILNQFINSGIVIRKEEEVFRQIVRKSTHFLKSNWTDLAVFVVCYIQVFAVLSFETATFRSMLSWQITDTAGEIRLNFMGLWNILIARPFLLFLFYRWLLRIVVWGIILNRISKLNLNLFAMHPDLCGGLGFLGYSIRYFSPVAFAISATVSGNIADFMLIEDMHLAELKFAIAGYFILITILFTLPLASFIRKLVETREKTVFENYDFANGMFRELRAKFSKGFYKVTVEDLEKPYYSSAADLSAVIENALKMKVIPFTWKDMIPLWIMAGIPFIGVIMIEVPVAELFRTVISFVM